MKKLLLLFAPLTLGLMVGCSYDDSAILDKIAEMEKEHDEMQAQIDTQQTLLDALANKLTITAVTETENGYIVKFSDGSTATISDGKDGDSFLKSIVVGEEDVTFTLADGTVIVIPLGSGGSSDGGEPSAEDNKIYYTTSDGKKLFPYNSGGAAFGAILISNTYDNGQGVLVFDDTITSIGYRAFYTCSSLASITIPDSVTSIGDSAFDGCKSLESITIPNSVTSIEWGAFEGCSSLESVTIPEGVTKIEWYAFDGCSSLAEVYCKPTTPPTGGYDMFNNNASGRKIYVPTESVEAYKSASYWSNYADNIVGYDFE